MLKVGDTKRIAAVTRALNENGDLVQLDPATLTVTVRDPLGNLTTYVYDTDPEVVQWVEGKYYIDVVPNIAGTWKWTWGATGNPGDVGTVVEPLDGSFLVEDLPVDVTFNVDDGVDPIEGSNVYVYAPRGNLVTMGTTNATGVCVLPLLPGPYEVQVTGVALAFMGVIDVDVTPLDTTFTVSGERFDPTAPSPAEIHLFGHIVGPDGRGRTDAVVTVESLPLSMYALGSGPTIKPASTAIMRAVSRTRPRSTDGYWQVDLIAGLMVRVRIPSTNYDQTFRVPSLPHRSRVNLADVRPDPGPTTSGIRTSRGAPGSSLVM